MCKNKKLIDNIPNRFFARQQTSPVQCFYNVFGVLDINSVKTLLPATGNTSSSFVGSKIQVYILVWMYRAKSRAKISTGVVLCLSVKSSKWSRLYGKWQDLVLEDSHIIQPWIPSINNIVSLQRNNAKPCMCCSCQRFQNVQYCPTSARKAFISHTDTFTTHPEASNRTEVNHNCLANQPTLSEVEWLKSLAKAMRLDFYQSSANYFTIFYTCVLTCRVIHERGAWAFRNSYKIFFFDEDAIVPRKAHQFHYKYK